jgi:hypothetical protein
MALARLSSPSFRLTARPMIPLLVLTSALSCTQEQQNEISRSIQNWTGTNGVLDVMSGGKLMYRLIQIDKLTTATATGGAESRSYRYGYGVMDLNQNYVADANEKKIYFEFSDYSTEYLFYESPM